MTTETGRTRLTWSFESISVHDEHDFDEDSGRHGPTGQVVGSTSAVITVRDLDQLPAIGETLWAIEHLGIDDVTWRVDHDNPAWPVVRSDAIAAALAKARDFATALSGEVVSVEHVADAGLLTGTGHASIDDWTAERGTAVMASSDGGGVPTLDPVPQEIRAVIEARVVAEVAPLRN